MRREENTRANVFTRRTVVIGGLQAALLAGLGSRLYGLQIARGDDYQTLSDENRIATRMLVPNRGLITDRDGQSANPALVDERPRVVLTTSGQTLELDTTLAPRGSGQPTDLRFALGVL